MAGLFDGISQNTITNYKKGAVDSVVENNPFLAYAFSNSRVERKQSGDALSGRIEAGRMAPRVSADGQDRSAFYTANQRLASWTLQWSQLSLESAVNIGELRRNDGPQALVKKAQTEVPAIYRDLLTNGALSLNGQLLGMNATVYEAGAGTQTAFGGLATVLPGNDNQQTMAQAITNYDLEGFDPDTGALTGLAPADTDIEVAIGGAPTYQNYAGLSMKYNAITGVDGLKADAWKSSLVNTSATSWSGTNDDEANAITKYAQYSIGRAGRFSGAESSFKPTFGVTTFDQLMKMGNKLTSVQNVYLTPGADSTNKFGTGFKWNNMVYHAGLWFWHDQAMPAGRGYVVNCDMMKFYNMPIIDTFQEGVIPSDFETNGGKVSQADLIESHVHFNNKTLNIEVAALINGQAWIHPRYQVGWAAYS